MRYYPVGLLLETAEKDTGVDALYVGELFDHIFSGAEFKVESPEVLFHEKWYVITLSTDTHLGHLTDRVELLLDGLGINLLAGPEVIGFVFQFFQQLICFFELPEE